MADEQPICPACGKPRLPECQDSNVFMRDPETGELLTTATGSPRVQKCPRIRAKQMREHLGPELASAKHIRGGSPLLTMDKLGKPPKVDLRQTNVFIKGSTWRGLLAHLRTALAPDLHYSFKIITDQQIKEVFVGSESYKARSKDMRDDAPTYNSLSDLVGQKDLIILRLGHLGHKNRAISGAILEALRIRETLRKPTWLVNEADHPWDRSHSYSPDLEDYIDDHFKTVKLKGVEPEEESPEEVDVGMGDEDEDDLEPSESPKPARKVRREPPPEPPDEPFDIDEDFKLPGEKPKWRRS